MSRKSDRKIATKVVSSELFQLLARTTKLQAYLLFLSGKTPVKYRVGVQSLLPNEKYVEITTRLDLECAMRYAAKEFMGVNERTDVDGVYHVWIVIAKNELSLEIPREHLQPIILKLQAEHAAAV